MNKFYGNPIWQTLFQRCVCDSAHAQNIFIQIPKKYAVIPLRVLQVTVILTTIDA